MNKSDLQYYVGAAAFLDAKAKANNGRLPLFERWRLNYCKKPFLYFETDEELTQRAYDAANNLQFLGEGGKIEARPPSDKYWFRVWETFQEANEEMNRRNSLKVLKLRKTSAEFR